MLSAAGISTDHTCVWVDQDDPINDHVDSEGNQLINWMAEIKQDTPMYPRGSNGTAQAQSARAVFANCLAGNDDPRTAFKVYKTTRIAATAKVVRTNREHPPDFINIRSKSWSVIGRLSISMTI